MCVIVINLTMFMLYLVVITVFYCDHSYSQQIPGASSSYGYKIGVQYNPDAIAFPSNVEPKNGFYHSPHNHDSNFPYQTGYHNHDLPHHHHHQHPNHHGFSIDDDNDSSEDNVQNNFVNSSIIPLDLIWKINNFTEVDDLLLNLVEGGEQAGKGEPVLATRFGEEERSAAIVPKAANCIPEMQTVKIISSDDPSVLYIPSCTRIERCGGCCSHSLLSCQPTETETVSYQVVKTQFVGGSKLKYMGKEVVLIEKHTKCKCSCKVQPKDCSSFQEYKKSECRCGCTNRDEEKKCYKENSTKLWNPDICGCQCRNILPCSTGYIFDTLKCKCVPILVRRRFADEDKIMYKSEALPVEPIDESDNTKT